MDILIRIILIYIIGLLGINYVFALFFLWKNNELTNKEKFICLIPYFMIFAFFYLLWEFIKDVIGGNDEYNK